MNNQVCFWYKINYYKINNKVKYTSCSIKRPSNEHKIIKIKYFIS